MVMDSEGGHERNTVPCEEGLEKACLEVIVLKLIPEECRSGLRCRG
jgi:hypothetical protein